MRKMMLWPVKTEAQFSQRSKIDDMMSLEFSIFVWKNGRKPSSSVQFDNGIVVKQYI